MNQHPITPTLIRDALAHIPATLPRDEWARVAMAIKSEFADSTGLDLFTEWSATADGFDTKATRSTWQSVKAGGGVGIGTLLHLAKENGFDLAKQGPGNGTPDPATVERLARERQERQQAEQARQQAAQANAASEAALLWKNASPTGQSAYLTRKGVQPYGVRFAADGRLLVPLRDAAGVLWNVQRIAPVKPVDGGTDKLFLKGGRKSGLWCLLGAPEENASNDTTLDPDNTNEATWPAPAVVLVCEGFATGASLCEATGYPVAVAFDAGNLVHVAKALRQCYPATLLALCGDDDTQTMTQNGHNPGRDKATAAARAVHGLAVFPAGLPDDKSDFNDLHQHLGGGAGLEAVRCIVMGAVDAHHASQQAAHAAPASKASKGRARGPQAANGAAADTDHAFDVFVVSEDGVWHNGIDSDGKRKPPEWVCSRLDVEALTRDQDGGGWGYLLNFADPLGNAKQWAMPARMLSGDGGEYRSMLLSMGLRIASSPRARNLLTQYLQTRKPDEFASCTDIIGWHSRAFVLPRETLGGNGERIVFQSDGPIENTFRTKGTPEQWRDYVGALCVGNSRLVFAVACAFAGPLFRPAGREGGGFHMRGDSGCGKSTAQYVAASVYGGPSFKRSWKSTDNALEATARQHNDCVLILDEIGEVDARAVGDVVYMLANGQGKARAAKTATAKPIARWRMLFLSTGEKSLSDHMAEGQKRTRAGQDVRMADIPADAGKGYGLFENLHGLPGGNKFAKHLTDKTERVYGTAGRAWLTYLSSQADTLRASIRSSSEVLFDEMIPQDASEQVERVGERFALVGAAGEMATAAGLTGWPAGESERAARACFNAWLTARGGNGNGEVVAMLRQVRRFLEAHGDGRFAMWHRGADDHAPKTLQRAGVRRMLDAEGNPIKTNNQHGAEYGDRMPAAMGEGVSYEYFVLADTFRGEVCQGFDYQAVCRVLLDHECLAPDKDRPFDCKARLPGIGNTRCFRITPAIFGLDL